MTEVSDLIARRRALDPTPSFIVQAPAGSGKTSLLTQRFLTLLGGVSCPEEILAITFTKKAAGEMRERILQALKQARREPRPEDQHLAHTWELAHRALQRNDEMSWGLEQNPARLRVLTIDSLCARLAAGLPILSQFGASPSPSEDSSEQYIEAARRTLEAIHAGSDSHRQAVSTLLLHLDNDLLRVQEQVAHMLAQRDKWMRPLLRIFGDLQEVGPAELREALEEALRRVTEAHLEQLHQRLGRENIFTLAELCRFAAGNLPDDHPLAVWREQKGMPQVSAFDLPLWQGFAQLLLTKSGTWRKKPDKRSGFPPEKEAQSLEQRSEFKTMLERAKALLAELGDDERLRLLLTDSTVLPPWQYSDRQWLVLQALLEVSRLAAAQLTLVFRDSGKTDFSEVAHRAVRALGTDDEPTDLAMAMDAKLQHLLVDEFQDTSLGQLELLSSLTREWIPGEGRTLFLVGDPMQSIYRFRDAEVGLFLQVREYGIGHIELESLTLRSNFRSQSQLVEWFNETFQTVFPKVDNPDMGSVSYSTAQAARPPHPLPSVICHPVLTDQDTDGEMAEAESVVGIVEEVWEEDPERRIAILVRSRTHLRELLPLLKECGHRFAGVDLEPLGSRPWIRDLLSITRAVSDLNDRLAWLSVLRAPWCGLASADLLVLAEESEWVTFPTTLSKWADLEKLSPDAQTRLSRVWPTLRRAVTERRRRTLRQAVEAVWLGLGGPAGLPSETALQDCHNYLDLLRDLEGSRSNDVLELLNEKLSRLYAQPDVGADGRLQIMTIHKSKGLEFDTVILPGLSARPQGSREPLVSWLEWATPEGSSHLLLAPITEKGQDKDPVYLYINNLEKKKEENEAVRLLYVAATRAKRQLHLIGQVQEDQKKDVGTLKSPMSRSFLGLLWPAVSDRFHGCVEFAPSEPSPHTSAKVVDIDALSSRLEQQEEAEEQSPEQEERCPATQHVLRLVSEWKRPPLPDDFQPRKLEILNEDELSESPKFEWAGETVRHVGTVVHRVLQQVGREGLDQWKPERLEGLRNYLNGKLQALGVPEEGLEPAVERSFRALRESLTSNKGRWILNPDHQEARSEYAISGVWAGRLVRSVVDRTFVDEQGVRWVVDFKTGSHLGSDENTFLEKEVERYKPQMLRYARLLRRLDDRPVKVGLYFPLLKAWREWDVEDPVTQPKQLEFQFE